MKPLFAFLILCSVAFGQIKLQPEYTVGQPLIVQVEYPDAPEGATPTDLEWNVGESGYHPLGDCSIAVWPKFGLKDTQLTISCSGPLTTSDGKYVPKSNRTFTATTMLRGLGPDPTPGPGPGPEPVPPQPDGEAPIKEPGFRVLITYESQQPIPRWLNDLDWRTMLNTVCVAGSNGVKEWRVVDKDSPAVANSGVWLAALERTKGKPTPWVLISTGKIGFEGPLPETKEAAMALVKRYAEAK